MGVEREREAQHLWATTTASKFELLMRQRNHASCCPAIHFLGLPEPAIAQALHSRFHHDETPSWIVPSAQSTPSSKISLREESLQYFPRVDVWSVHRRPAHAPLVDRICILGGIEVLFQKPTAYITVDHVSELPGLHFRVRPASFPFHQANEFHFC